MATEFTLDVTQVTAAFKKLEGAMQKTIKQQAAQAVGDELLRLSQFEVPLEIGTLANTGVSEQDGDEQIVGYNTPYAAKLHENPQFNFQNGRKGKYLEQPIKENLSALNQIFGLEVDKRIKAL